jgi:hypothetical protein
MHLLQGSTAMRFGSSYFGCRITPHVKDDMRYLADNGFDYVVHVFSENDMKYHLGTMTDIVGVTRDAGLEVLIDPWGVLQLFGGEAFSHWLNVYPEIKQVAEDGTPLPVACPNNRKTLELMTEWAFAAKSTGADEFFWDEPHMYIPEWFNDSAKLNPCFCPACQEKYKKFSHRDLPWTYDDTVKEFNRQSLTDFMFDLARLGRQCGLKNSVCLLPSDLAGDTSLDWHVVASMDDIDTFGSDPYWALHGNVPEVYVPREVRKVMSVCEKYKKDHLIWLQGFKIPDGKEEEVGRAFDIMAEADVQNVAIWGFKACKYISEISCANPDDVWDLVLKKIKRYK